ncbi:hypothetical protein ACLOJK_041196 [Asimina triloba]
MAKLIKYPMVFVLLLLTVSTLFSLCRGGEPADAIMDGQKKMMAIDGSKPVGMNMGSKIFISPCFRSLCKVDSTAAALASYEIQRHGCWCCLTVSPRRCFRVKTNCWAACPRPPSSRAP